MSCEKMIDVRVQTPEIVPFEVKIGRRTVQLDRIRIGEREFRKVISQTPMSYWYTDNFDDIRDTGGWDARGFDVRQLPDICFEGLSDPLDVMNDDDGDMMMQDMSELISAQTSLHAVVIARTLSLGLDPYEWFSSTPAERDRIARLQGDAPPAFAAPAAEARTKPEPAPAPAPAPAPVVKEAAPASPGGTLFFGNPADVKERRVLVFDFLPDGLTVRAYPKTKAEFTEQFELTPRQIAAVRISIRHVLKNELDMPHPAAVPDPRAVRTATRVVASVDEGALLRHLIWRVKQRSSWGFTSARGWFDAEMGVGPRIDATPRLTMARMGRGELISRMGEGRAATVGLTKERSVPA